MKTLAIGEDFKDSQVPEDGISKEHKYKVKKNRHDPSSYEPDKVLPWHHKKQSSD